MDKAEIDSVNQFNNWSKIYDSYFFWPFYFSNKKIIDSIKITRDTAFLDVGCGTGILLQQLYYQNMNLKLFGVDISPEMVKKARTKLHKSICIEIASSNNIPHKDNSFDIVTCSTSYHHYPNPQNTLKEMHRVLKPGGTLLLLDPFTNGFIRTAICKTLNTLFKESDTNLFTKEQMFKIFSEAGFSSIQQRTFSFYKLITLGKKN